MLLYHLGKVSTIVLAKIRLLDYLAVEPLTLKFSWHLPKVIVQCARSAPYDGFSVSFQTAEAPCVCCILYGDYCAEGSYLMSDVLASACQ
jgi:hypothetical protein